MGHYLVVFGEWLRNIGIENREATKRYSKHMKDNPEIYRIQSMLWMGLFMMGLSFFLGMIHVLNFAAFHFSVNLEGDSLMHPANVPIRVFIADVLMHVMGITLVMIRGVGGKVLLRKSRSQSDKDLNYIKKDNGHGS